MACYKHWKFKALSDKHGVLWSPTIHDSNVNSFGMCREVYKELKALEKLLLDVGFGFYVIYTDLKNDHIMKLLSKIGCSPYTINLKTNTLWFRKEL